MISKVVSTFSFYQTCRYVCANQGAEVLLAEGVRSYSYLLMADDFTRQQGMRPSKRLACFHGILSFYPGEKLSRERMAEIAQKYLQGLGIVGTQYAVCKHSDRAHAHLHLVANLVDNKGKAIKESFLVLQSIKVARKLTTEYGLVQAREKNLGLTNLERLSKPEAARYRIYQSISEVLPRCRSLEHLQGLLGERGIETRYRYKGQSTERQGISFKLGPFCFKGSSVDRKCSLLNLQHALALQQGRGIDTEEMASGSGLKASAGPEHTEQLNAENRGEKQAGQCGKEFLGSLLRTANSREPVAIELLKKKRSKNKNHSLGL